MYKKQCSRLYLSQIAFLIFFYFQKLSSNFSIISHQYNTFADQKFWITITLKMIPSGYISRGRLDNGIIKLQQLAPLLGDSCASASENFNCKQSIENDLIKTTQHYSCILKCLSDSSNCHTL